MITSTKLKKYQNYLIDEECTTCSPGYPIYGIIRKVSICKLKNKEYLKIETYDSDEDDFNNPDVDAADIQYLTEKQADDLLESNEVFFNCPTNGGDGHSHVDLIMQPKFDDYDDED